MTVRPSIAVIVLNWNGAEDTIACLQSLRRATVPVHIIVVDNGSTDDSLRQIEASALADTVVPTGMNLGYAGGNNAGLRVALDGGFQAVGVLNNDTLVAPTTLALLIDALPASQHTAVSPDIRYVQRPGETWFAGGVIDRGWPRHLQPAELAGDERSLRPSEWLSGCCIVARPETWEHVGLFDASYFLILEDSEWSMRAVRRGVSLYVVTQCTIQHHVSRTLGQGPGSLLGSYYFVRNGLRFAARYFPNELARLAFRWVVRPSPGLFRSRRIGELVFRSCGAVAFATRLTGRAPRVLEQLAARLTH